MPQSRVIRFGPFEANLDSGELRRDGARLRLQAQPFQILALLLSRPGEVVSKDEIREKLWHADTFVDFDHSLGTAINKIRGALRDSAEQPLFIETLPKRGYRFIGVIANSEIPSVPAEPTKIDDHRISRWPIMAWIFTTVLVLLAVFLVSRALRPHPATASVAHTPIPFTTLPGNETAAAFSPDGSRVAFGWDSDPASGKKGYDLYVKADGGETLLRLTQHPSKWISPAWSPDGTQIAFHRIAGSETGLYIVPALGGPERKLRSTHVPYDVAAPISWSPDGKWIAFSDPRPDAPEDRMFMLSVETLETKPIPHNPKCLHEAVPTFSHKGDKLAYVCVHNTNEFELYWFSLPEGAPQFITSFSKISLGVSWSADDRRLVFSQATDGGPELDEVNLQDHSRRRLDFATAAVWPSFSPKGDKLAYSSYSGKNELWRKDLLHPESPPVQFIASTRTHEMAQFSPDGQHIALTSNRAGSWDIWMSDADASNLVQLTKLEGNSSMPRWSPDGKQIAFEFRRSDSREVYLVDVSARVSRKLVTNIPEIAAPSWSRDGKWIYFMSYEAKGHKIYRCPSTGGDAIVLGGQPDGTSPQESSSGDVLYFAARIANTGLKKITLDGNFPASAVDGVPAVIQGDLWALVPGGIYFVPADSPKSIRYFDFATKKNRLISDVPCDIGDTLSVSPDGRWLLYSQVVGENSNIMLVENFH